MHERIIIGGIKRGKAGEHYGLRPSDEVVEINGLSVANISFQQFCDQMELPEISLKIRRKGEKSLIDIVIKKT